MSNSKLLIVLILGCGIIRVKILLLGDVLILGSRKAPGVEDGCLVIEVLSLIFQVRVVHF